MNESAMDGSAIGGFVIGVICGALIAILALVSQSSPHTVIVKHTKAYYHPDTGAFTWPDKEDQ